MLNARKAHNNAIQAFGPGAALSHGTALPLANCLIELGRAEEASKLLDGIDTKAVAQLAGDPDWGAGGTLARAQIAFRQHRYQEAQTFLAAVRPVFSRPDAEAYQKHGVDALSAAVAARLAAK